MTEQIGKVTLDYTFYNGQDQYSDGDIENDLLQLIMEEPDVEKILAEDDRWPVLYHFSPVRQNILEWYPFKKDASVLEIGAGCGAISGVLCRNAKHVTSVDLSKRRSLINANRNKEYDNLTIMVGNFNDVVLKEKYDYITLIGVLEYAGYYTDDEHPFEAFLKKISGYLKEDGKLLIAIENKFGLKYWAGSREDHTGKFFDGLEGYIDTDSKVRTFSKEALKKIITDAGYGKAEFYYPVLMTHGEKDGLVSVQDTYDFFKEAGSEDKQMKIYGGLFHEILNEYCKDEVIGDMIRWMEVRI